MRFVRDENDACRNLVKHGVTFEEATTVFGDPLSDTSGDPDHSAEGRRFIIVGMSERGRILIVAQTEDGNDIRIISPREPTRGERKFYEEGRS